MHGRLITKIEPSTLASGSSLAPSVVYEYLNKGEGAGGGDVLPKLAGAPVAILRSLAPVIRDLLERRRAGNISALVDALEVVLIVRTEDFDSRLPNLASRRCKAAGADAAMFAAWWVARASSSGSITPVNSRAAATRIRQGTQTSLGALLPMLTSTSPSTPRFRNLNRGSLLSSMSAPTGRVSADAAAGTPRLLPR